MDWSAFMPSEHQLHLSQFLVQAAFVLVAVKVAGHLSHRLGQPSVFGKLLVGLIVGPAMLGLLTPNPFLKEMSEIGVILLMFLAGLETNIMDLRKSAKAASFVAVAGVVLPFLGGWGLSTAWGYEAKAAIFIGVLLVATSVSISVQTLRELGKLQTKEGVTILGAAVIDDVLGLLVLSTVLGLSTGSGGLGAVGALLVKVPLFFALAAFLGLKVLPPILKWASHFKVGAPLIAFGIATALAFAGLAEVFGIAGIVGAYVCGLALAASPVKEELYHEMEVVTFSAFTPFFFIGVGLSATVAGLSGSFWIFLLILILVAIVTKLLGCGFGAWLAGMKGRSVMAVGAGMVARGEVGLIVAGIGLDRGLIGKELFTGMVLVSLATTLVTPPLLKAVMGRKRLESPTVTTE